MSIECHDDHFSADAEDVKWIELCAERGWYVISADERIRYNHLEKQAVIKAEIGVFILACSQSKASDQVKIIGKCLTKIHAVIRKRKRPFIETISCNGKVTNRLNHKDTWNCHRP